MMILTEKVAVINTQFLEDTLQGLSTHPKQMHSKYFYDEAGDLLFQRIMNMPEYYLTDAEMEIMQLQANEIAATITVDGSAFDLIELGAGDATKSIHLLSALVNNKVDFKYFPIDISEHVISELDLNLPKELPTLDFEGLNGDYFEMLQKATEISDRRKVVLFMGANIGNMSVEEAVKFCESLKKLLAPQDMLVIGFDLKKNPKKILDAYNDKTGITRNFNLNLLKRINRELNGNFNIDTFEHYASYNPETGECKSYLISLQNQSVQIGDSVFQFEQDEFILMEISQKYSIPEIESLALQSGFNVKGYFSDKQRYFVDALWSVA